MALVRKSRSISLRSRQPRDQHLVSILIRHSIVPHAVKQKLNSSQMIGRPGRPEEIVGPCLMLSSKAGGYMNGGMLLVEGGRFMVSSLNFLCNDSAIANGYCQGAGINDGLRMPEDTYVN